jgi:putative ATPase
MEELDYGKDYLYSHDNLDKLHLQEFLPDEIKGTHIYKPKQNKKESEYGKLIEKIWKGKY